jgi:hypothetical protein
MSYAKAADMRFLFIGTPEPTTKGLLNSDLRVTTQVFAWLSMLLALPTVITNFNYIDEKTIPLLYALYTLIEFSGPVLMLIGATKLDFSLCYTGTFIYSIFTICEMTVKLAFGLVLGLLILPSSVYPPVAAIAYMYLTFYIVGWLVLLVMRLYVNFIFFSFTKHLGLGTMYRQEALLIVPAMRVVPQDEIVGDNIINDPERRLTVEDKIYPQTVPSKIIEQESTVIRDY